jgi:hypothetical protein
MGARRWSKDGKSAIIAGKARKNKDLSEVIPA